MNELFMRLSLSKCKWSVRSNDHFCLRASNRSRYFIFSSNFESKSMFDRNWALRIKEWKRVWEETPKKLNQLFLICIQSTWQMDFFVSMFLTFSVCFFSVFSFSCFLVIWIVIRKQWLSGNAHSRNKRKQRITHTLYNYKRKKAGILNEMRVRMVNRIRTKKNRT